ncbi:MAG: hypothetical protein HYS13_24320 [Planctomycetia bacterium]|nr:hypothetical protein [Planctomycetia bacterium]
MSRLLAIEWDAREARVAVATCRGKEAVIEQAFAVDLQPREGGGSPTEVNVAQRLRDALAERGIGKAETLVALGRANIELRVLSVPAAPDEEMPDLVRFQAMRQFASIGEDWPLDFVPLEHTSEGTANVLAAAVAPELVKQIRGTCEAAGLEPLRLVLRPFAAAALLRRRAQDRRCRLMVDLLTDEADLTVLADGQVAFMRTVRLASHDPEPAWRALLGEMRRTIAAAHQQLGNRRVELVTICGDPSEHGELKAAVASQLSLEIEYFDPFTGPPGKQVPASGELMPLSLSGAISLTPHLLKVLPEHPGRFAPLLGMLAAEAGGTAHAIDFLHPRHRPAPPSRRGRWVTVGASVGGAVAVALVVMVGWLWSLDSQITGLKKKSFNMDKEVKAAQKLRANADRVDEFVSGDVVWLEELRELSTELPPPEEATVAGMTFGTRVAGGGGQLIADGYVRQSSTIDLMERKLRDERHKVSGTGGGYEDQQPTLRWRFKETIQVLPEEEVARPAPRPTRPPAQGGAR